MGSGRTIQSKTQNPMASGIAFEASQAARLEGKGWAIRVTRDQERRQPPEEGQVADDQGVAGPRRDLAGEGLNGIVRGEPRARLRLSGAQQGFGEYRGGLLGPGLAAVKEPLDADAGLSQHLGEALDVLAPLFAQGTVGVDVLGDCQTVLG